MEKKVSHKNELECKLEKDTHPDLIQVSYSFFKNLIEENQVTLAYNEAKYYKKDKAVAFIYNMFWFTSQIKYFINE